MADGVGAVAVAVVVAAVGMKSSKVSQWLRWKPGSRRVSMKMVLKSLRASSRLNQHRVKSAWNVIASRCVRSVVAFADVWMRFASGSLRVAIAASVSVKKRQ